MKSVISRLVGVLLLLTLVLGAGYLGFSGSTDLPALNSLLAWLQPEEPATAMPPTPPVTISVTQGEVSQTVIAPGQLENLGERVLTFAVSGQVETTNVRPGDRVAAGQILAELNQTPLYQALELAELKLAQAEATREQQLAEAQFAVESAQTNVTQAQASYPSLTAAEVRLEQAREAEAYALNEYQKAQDRPWEPAEMLEGYRQQYERAVDARVVAEAEYNSVLQSQWANSQNVAAANISLEQAQLQLDTLTEQGADPLLQWDVDKAEADLAAATLTAPYAGVVLEVQVRPGEAIGAGQTILVLADVSQGELLASVVEEDLPLVQPGQSVEIFFDAAPDVTISGTVNRIVPQRTSGSDRPLYPVYITITDLPTTLLPGMTADAVITIQKKENVLQLPRAIVRASSGNTATVDVWDGQSQQQRTIEIGLRGDVYVEVVSGLHEGEEVVGQ
jgi:multidrug efflux pump subunit AcrA (membrane-fusion protein)